jgi:prevent-host-death family protein
MKESELSSMGAYEAKVHFSELLERVATGEEILITKHGNPVARMVPAKKTSTTQSRLEAIQKIRQLSSTLSLGAEKVSQLKNSGRR